ncbi:MAG: hypothetical protein HUU54_15545 [Ignavibacteriaceae bacterium]|nr:hypothetical protein [Ignavibacteriaceae bacterium]
MKSFLFLFLFSVPLAAQMYHKALAPTAKVKVTREYNTLTGIEEYVLGVKNYGFWREIIPNTNPVEYKYYDAHTVYKYSIDVSVIPQNAYNISASIEVWRGAWSSGDSKIISIPDNLNISNLGDCWYFAEIGGTLFQVPHNSGIENDVTSLVLQNRSLGYFHIGARQSTNNLYTNGYIEIIFHVRYDLPFEMIVKNNFYDNSGNSTMGLMNVDGQTQTTPYQFTRNAGSQVTLEAISPQTDIQNHTRVWHSGVINKSYWSYNDDFFSNDQTVSFTASAGSYEARLRKRFDILRIDDLSEFDYLVNQGIQTQIVEQNSGQISAQAQQTVNNRTYLFAGWSDGNVNNPRTIYPQNNETSTALFKYPHHSSSGDAYESKGQRKFVRTIDGTLHTVYTSMNKVWYEISTDQGVTWQIMNGGMPLNEGNGKLPSIDCFGNSTAIVYQQEAGTGYKIYLKRFYANNGYVLSHSVEMIYENEEYYSTNANPVIEWGYNGKAILVWERKYNNGIFPKFPGLEYKYFSIGPNGVTNISEGSIPYTDVNSVNPTLHGDDCSESFYALAWQQNISAENSEIRHYMINGNSNGIAFSGYKVASNGRGFTKNTNPSITSIYNGSGQGARLTWVGYRKNDMEEERGLEKIRKEQGLDEEYRCVFVDPTNLYQTWVFGSEVSSVNINSCVNPCGSGGYSIGYVIGWGENNGQSNKCINHTLNPSNIKNMGITGRNIQINNGITNTGTMFGLALGASALPYTINQSGSIQSLGLNKETVLQIKTAREGVVYKDSSQFYFSFGDIEIDGIEAEFVTLPDSIVLDTKDNLSSYMITEPFQLSDNSTLYYSVQYGVLNSSAARTIFENGGFLSFKVQLISADGNTIFGEYDNVNYTIANLNRYENIQYEVTAAGIGSQNCRLRLVIDENISPSFSLSQKYAADRAFAKGTRKRITYNSRTEVRDYALFQNHPNPYNPETSIKYQIPEAGLVSLKVYDILGREITTLVNETKPAGSYSVNFNASHLPSVMINDKL